MSAEAPLSGFLQITACESISRLSLYGTGTSAHNAICVDLFVTHTIADILVIIKKKIKEYIYKIKYMYFNFKNFLISTTSKVVEVIFIPQQKIECIGQGFCKCS